ncbi:MAG: membrane protein insertion efficiency factor YidD [Candidatus Yonathbacteria bacterium]|nr:membrane protein insertion efficiency factor YidD [Candidatus Yonathbacteria bacterium]
MKYFFIHAIRWYQKVFSPDKGILVSLGIRRSTTCAFYPTCSDYTIEAITKYGVLKGIFMGIQRVLRCHPWQKPTIDPLV